MRTLFVSDPPEIVAIRERRKALGQDRYDEVWEGVYHVAPEAHGRHGLTQVSVSLSLSPLADAVGLWLSGPFNLGTSKDDFRVPDFGFHQVEPLQVWVPTAVIVGEVLSPDDESRDKLAFYAARGVEEVLLVDPPRAHGRAAAARPPGVGALGGIAPARCRPGSARRPALAVGLILLARRCTLGPDGHDEVWEGVYHVAPHAHGADF